MLPVCTVTLKCHVAGTRHDSPLITFYRLRVNIYVTLLLYVDRVAFPFAQSFQL